MQLRSVNIGALRILGDQQSGIFKQPVTGEIELSQNGLIGDSVGDKIFHGGPDQAVYVYGLDDYLWWNQQLDKELAAGTFGDNLTFRDLSSTSVNIGDRFAINNTVLEATAPRIPCATLGQRMGDPKFPVAFRRAARPGFYCRVIEPGTVCASLSIEYIRTTAPDPLSIVELFNLYYDPNPAVEYLQRALAAPIAIRERRRLQDTLVKVGKSN